jgi:hypothetical protein
VKTYDLIKVAAVQASDGFQDANGYIMPNSTIDVDVEVVPYGTEYPAPLVLVNPTNQFDGLTSGTPDLITPGAVVYGRTATSLTGNGSGATFAYASNDPGGDIFLIFADSAGTGYLEGDHISITTTAAHGSQTLSFRLVTGSNRAEVPVTLIHDRQNPLDFAVREYKVLGTTDRTVMVLREHT